MEDLNSLEKNQNALFKDMQKQSSEKFEENDLVNILNGLKGTKKRMEIV